MNDGKQEIAIQNIVTRKHRLKNQELSKDIKSEDPSIVMKEIHDVKDMITEKIKHVKTDDEADEKTEETSRRRRRENRV